MAKPSESRFVIPVEAIPDIPGLLDFVKRSALKKSTKGKWYAPFGDSYSAKYKLLLDGGGVFGVPEYNKTYETWAVRVTISKPVERTGLALFDDACRELAKAGSDELKTAYPYKEMLEEGEIYLPITNAKIVNQKNEPVEMKDIENLKWQRLAVEISFLSFKVNEKKESTERSAAVNRAALFIQVSTEDGKNDAGGIDWYRPPGALAAADEMPAKRPRIVMCGTCEAPPTDPNDLKWNAMVESIPKV